MHRALNARTRISYGRAEYLDYELGSVLLVLPLFVEALHDACVGSLFVVGDELLNYIGDLLSARDTHKAVAAISLFNFLFVLDFD